MAAPRAKTSLWKSSNCSFVKIVKQESQEGTIRGAGGIQLLCHTADLRRNQEHNPSGQKGENSGVE